ncbi:PREDICTED: centromere protein W [Merops nubicus]|uniref:centromere protein W n=1 Tax=Merops nubicus TaxID=57421 RepID=UPI0004F02DA1|nr:PREDICTED: centromere protein W [Merops nubicus]
MDCAHWDTLELQDTVECQVATNGVSAVTYRQSGGKVCGEIDGFADQVHLNFLLFLHRLAEEARTNAFENRSQIIKTEHIIAAAKVILKKSRG